MLEEFGKVSSAVAFPIFECLVGPIKAVQRFGTDEMKRRLLPDITAGEFVVAVAMSEPEAGSAATDMITAAKPDASVDGGMILTGQKRYVHALVLALVLKSHELLKHYAPTAC